MKKGFIIVSLIISAGFIASIVMFFYLIITATDPLVIGKSSSLTFEEVERRAIYHGTNFAFLEDGEWFFFDIKGRRCKL